MSTLAKANNGNEPAVGRRAFLSGAALAVAGSTAIVAKTVLSRKQQNLSSTLQVPAILPIRRMPVAIPPHGELADIVSLESARDLLLTLIPTWIQAVKIDNLIHAFRLWGAEAQFPEEIFVRPFPDRRVFSGKEMEATFLDSQRFQETFPLDPPILVSYKDGVVQRTGFSPTRGGDAGALVHRDKLLRALAEQGYPSDTPIRAVKGDIAPIDGKLSFGEIAKRSIDDMVRGTVAYFDIKQEMEWTVESLARYLAPSRTWTNRFGQSYTFDDVARGLLDRPAGEGSCYGLHGLYALICLWRIDQEHNLLSPSVHVAIERFLRERSRRLEAVQNSLGLFSTELDLPAVKQDPYEDRSKWIHGFQLIVVAHHLEWIALAPEGLRPNRDTVRRAVDALIAGLEPWSMFVRSGEYGPLTHAGKCLCGLLGRSPKAVVFCKGDEVDSRSEHNSAGIDLPNSAQVLDTWKEKY